MEPQIFASAGGDDTIKVWNLGKRSVIQSLKDTGKGYINQIGFYNGLEKSLLISSHSEKGSVKVWDYKKGVCLAKWEACKQAIKSVLFHPRLPYIFTAAKDGEIRVWNDSNYQEVASYFRAWDGDFNGMGACKTSDMLILAGNAEFRVVQVVKKREEKVLEQKEKEVQPNHRQSLTKDRENPVLATPSLESDYRIRQEGPRVEPGCKKVVDEMSADHRAVERMLTQKIEKMEVDMQAAVVRLETKLAEAMSMHKSLEGCKSRISQLESERDKLTERVNELEHKFKKEITTKRERTALLREFSGKELLDATNNFEVNLRSRDGNWHEHVYSGKLRDGTLIAVKRMRDHASAQIIHDRNEMKTEVVDRLRLLQHPHLLTLLGVCYEESCLVYEHMERGSLKNWIVQGENHTGGSLPWYARFRVMAEVARGLDFLHSDLSASRGGPVIHCAIKPTNILLDQNFVAKIGGVDQALLVPTTPDAEGKTSVAPEFAAHNSQYIAPEYWQSRVFDEKTDVYAFGITLLEMLTGYFSNAFKVIEDSIEDLPAFERALDANAGIWDVDLARKVANLGLRCASPNARERPGMTTPGVGILPVLEGVARKVDLAQSISDHQR
ncbi:hypothetical protein CBR_g54922 [Chara braunii]|uniref:Protein kinase domain-containing protein n=1 Tax=Chara braunii TaxID=69332 RepID=A0A388JPV6_CHABU|nr:hypothetical protein CBR_g54922 [Chara braunii]|eukprot:GBG59820.1 hypothetical protein CBR_g54922 [Chara braunii]